jgi:hypothetical protein
MQVVVREHDERPHEVVPAREEGEQGERHDDRPQQRHDDAGEDRGLARAVDARGLEQLVGDRQAYWRTRKMPKMPASAGTITPPSVFTRPSS